MVKYNLGTFIERCTGTKGKWVMKIDTAGRFQTMGGQLFLLAGNGPRILTDLTRSAELLL